MEPMNCVARVGRRQGQAHLRLPDPHPRPAERGPGRRDPARRGRDRDPVRRRLLRPARQSPTPTTSCECVHIAKHVGGGRPVKLVWTREDDMTGGRYRPLAHHAIQVGIGRDGFPHRLAPPHRHPVHHEGLAADEAATSTARRSRGCRARPTSTPPRSSTARLRLAGLAGDRAVVALGRARPTRPWPWSTPSTSWPSAPARTPSPIAGRSSQGRRPTGTWPCSTWPAQKAGWGQPLEDGWTRGVAVHESFGSVVAKVAEVKLVDGAPKVAPRGRGHRLRRGRRPRPDRGADGGRGLLRPVRGAATARSP